MFSEKRFNYLAIAPILILLLIVARLFYLQVVKGELYLQRSESNFIQERPIAHNRGLIIDQSGIALVDNRPAHDLYVTFALLPDSFKTLRKLGGLIGVKAEKLKEFHQKLAVAIDNLDPNPVSWMNLKGYQKCTRLNEFVLSEQIGGVEISDSLRENDSCKVEIIPSQFPSQKGAFKILARMLDVDDDEMDQLVVSADKKARGLGQFKPVVFMSDISFEAYARISSAISLGALSGVAIFDSIKRRYIHGKMASHALGYLNEISGAEIKRRSEYKPGDRIGRKGLELVYEDVLRGEDGVERFVVDAKGRRYAEAWERQLLGDLRMEAPKGGHSLILSIDWELQKAIEKAFLGKAGSVVAIEVGTGFVLAMASFPEYDPNLIVGRDNKKMLQAMSKDPLKPWINKALQEHYAPGSTFKAVTAVAAMENKLITPRTLHNCTGNFHLGNATWRCFKREGHGNVAMVEALKTSCDSYFYQLGYQLGPDRLAATARLLGFGRRTGIDLDMEIPGNVPDKSYYQRRLGYYAPGFVVNNAIGQGEVTVTPLQLAVAYDALINGGRIYRPQLVRQIIDPNGQIVQEHAPIQQAHLTENLAELDNVREGLSYVMKQGGTAYGIQFRADLPELSKWMKDSGVVIGGKTGTAQVVRLSKAIKHLRPEEVSYLERDHAWFVGFAPVEKPEIVVVAMTEHGGFGGSTSAPVVAEAVKTWYERVRGRGRYEQAGAFGVSSNQ